MDSRRVLAAVAELLWRGVPRWLLQPGDLGAARAAVARLRRRRGRRDFEALQNLLSEGSLATRTQFESTDEVALSTRVLSTGDLVTRVDPKAVHNERLAQAHRERVESALSPLREAVTSIADLGSLARVSTLLFATAASGATGSVARHWLALFAPPLLAAAAGLLSQAVLRRWLRRRLGRWLAAQGT